MMISNRATYILPHLLGLTLGWLILHPLAMIFAEANTGPIFECVGEAFWASFRVDMIPMTSIFALLGAAIAYLGHTVGKAAAPAPEGHREPRRGESLVRICMYCKSVPEMDSGGREHWMPIEQALQSAHRLEFSHGVCPTCYTEFLEPELWASKARKNHRAGCNRS